MTNISSVVRKASETLDQISGYMQRSALFSWTCWPLWFFVGSLLEYAFVNLVAPHTWAATVYGGFGAWFVRSIFVCIMLQLFTLALQPIIRNVRMVRPLGLGLISSIKFGFWRALRDIHPETYSKWLDRLGLASADIVNDMLVVVARNSVTLTQR